MRRATLVFETSEAKISVCPWQYYQCVKPAKNKCPVMQRSDKGETLDQYKSRVFKAEGCRWAELKLTCSQWTKQQLEVRV